MNKIKTIRINYYILLSVLIHSFFFLFIREEKDLTQGEKIIPIEVIDALLESGYGEATKRSKKLIKRPLIKEELKNEINNKNPLDQEKLFEDNKNKKKINEKKFEQKKDKSNSINKPLLKLNIILIISVLVFMLIGYDWGRWINIGYTFAILSIFFLIKNNDINFLENYLFKITKKFYNNYSKIYYFIFFCYIFTWNMKVIMTDDIGSFPYYRILNKTIKIIGMYI